MEFSQSRSQTSYREPVRAPGLELDSVMEFAKFHYTIQLATTSRAGLRPASEMVR